MNTLFTVIFLIAAFFMLCSSPENFLSALLDGAQKSATVSVSLLSSYAVWLGVMQIWEDSGLTEALSKRLKPLAKKIFKTDDTETLNAVCMNLSVNLLGISGAGTAYGIKAAKLLDKSPEAEYASSLFFVLNATSIQLFPTSLIAMRISMQSATPNDIVLPILLTSLFSTLLGVLLTQIFIRKNARSSFSFKRKRVETQGAGI